MFDTQRLQTAIQSLNREGRFASEKTFLHHRKITVYDHSVHVAEVSLKIADFLPVTVDEDSLIRGALLHDYFLYRDKIRHDPIRRSLDVRARPSHLRSLYHRNESVKTYVLHGYRHPMMAAENAKKDYGINDIEENIIRRHMFPLTPIPPKYREAWIVCIADKYCAALEYLPARLTRNHQPGHS